MRFIRRTPSLTEGQLAELRTTAREWIGPGFRGRDGLAEELADYRDDFAVPSSVKVKAARRVVDEVWRDCLAEQASWPDTGDFARLQRAFGALQNEGLVCRMNFTCCQTCGTAEIDDERTPLAIAAEGDYPYVEWAYTFFHQQDAERLVDPGPLLYLTYSAFRPAPNVDPNLVAKGRAGDDDAWNKVIALTDLAVGELVRDALQSEGLTVEWNGTTAQRIGVRLPEWRKPLPLAQA